MDILSGLNVAQKKAVECVDGPLLILAGAGSGKTKTLTHRIAYLISVKHINPSQILAVTFTNKASKEMRSRLGLLLGQNSDNRSFMPWMGTFHGICVRLLRTEGKHIGLNSNFVIYDENDKQGVIKQSIKQLGIDPKVLKPQAVASIISSSKNDLISAGDYANSANYPNQKNIAKIYQKYELNLKKSGALDFDDLLLETIRLFEECQDIKNKWSNYFKHIMIDEYQDTNSAQYSIVKHLIGKEKNICVVGDDWQSIYSWRGADFKNILNFEKDFIGATVIKLEQNYRSTNNILKAAQKVIENNKNRTDKKLWTELEGGEPVHVHSLRDESEEAHFVADRIYSQYAIKARKYDEFSVLYRTNAQSLVLEKAFINFRIPYKIVGGTKFYDRKEIKDIIAYLKFIYQPNDEVSFRRIANVPARSIGDSSLEKFLAWHFNNQGSILSSLSLIDNCESLNSRAKKSFVEFEKVISKLKINSLNTNPGELIEQLIKMINYKEYLDDGSELSQDRIENVGSLISEAQHYATLTDYLEEVSLMSSSDSDSEKDKVTLMTLHAAKGLEFPVVFITGLEEGILPHSRVYDSGKIDDLEEERRLMYVGMTRARQELHLCYALSRSVFGNRTYNSASRFITEMDATYATNESINTASNLEDDLNQSIDFDIGDMVNSSAFGNGEIIDIDGLAVTVKFKNGKTKKLNIQYARLDKI